MVVHANTMNKTFALLTTSRNNNLAYPTLQKQREARKADKEQEEMDIYIQYVKYFLALTVST